MTQRKIFTPRPYQTEIINKILDNTRINIWAGMGTGKTVSVLTALDMLFLSGVETKPALVVAPLRVANSVWGVEAEKWTHLTDIRVQPITGAKNERLKALTNTNANVFTINYENIPWLEETLKGEWPFGVVVCDESTKLKGFRIRQGAQRARSLAKIAHKSCTRWINLTGTPASNGLVDLWGQNWFIDTGTRLGRTYSAFENRWFRLGYDGFSREPYPHAQEQIQGILKDVCVSINANEHFDIKEPVINKIYVDLPPKAMSMYKDMEREMFLELETGDTVVAANAAVRTMKLLQLANGAIYNDEERKTWAETHDMKLQALEEIVEEAAGNPILVAYHFKSDLERLKKKFPKGRLLDKDPKTIRDWNTKKIPLLFAHPASAGHGLNLQDGGHILVFFAHNWNLEEFLQIIERIGPTRQAQSGHDVVVFIHHIIARNTIDELVFTRRETKRTVQDILIEAMKQRKEA